MSGSASHTPSNDQRSGEPGDAAAVPTLKYEPKDDPRVEKPTASADVGLEQGPDAESDTDKTRDVEEKIGRAHV